MVTVSRTLARFPRQVTVEDGTVLEVRPLVRDDAAALHRFFCSIPAEDRYWLREDVSDPGVILRWVGDLDYERVLPLVAVRDGEIVADATLHRRGFGARRFIGEVRMVVAPGYRRRGLAYALLAELYEAAQEAGLERLEAEIVQGAQNAAREAVEQFGFREFAVLPDHLRGADGRPRDLSILLFQIEAAGGRGSE
jgi:GNAT superfamily N-acetyltransferase